MRINISVVIPTHNPNPTRFERTLGGLRSQTLDREEWEVIIVDNQSDLPINTTAQEVGQRSIKIVRENALGLTSARICGFRAAKGDLVVLVDDDNVLAPDYLSIAWGKAQLFPLLGTWGGAITAEYEASKYSLPSHLEHFVSARSVARPIWSNDPSHHPSTPWGAGMCIRRPVFEAYLEEVAIDPRRGELDLKGAIRKYGGDTDIAYTGCRMGLGKGVFPELKLVHLVGSDRCDERFLRKVAFGRGYSETVYEYLTVGKTEMGRTSWLGTMAEFIRQWRLTPLERSLRRALIEGQRQAVRELRN